MEKAVKVKKQKNSNFKNSKLYRLGYDNRFVLLSFLVSCAVCLLIEICYSMWPFGDISILRMDLYHQYGPLFGELYDRIVNGQGLSYSWESGGGGIFVGQYFNYLSSPLSILVLIFGHKNIPQAVGFLIFLKGSLAAGSMTYYFKASNQFKMHNPITAGFGMLYAFSSYYVAYYWNIMWIDGMILLPLIMLGIEQIVDDGHKPWLYTIALALIMISSYYMSYIIAIFSVLYFLIYYIGKYELGDTVITLTPDDKGKINPLQKVKHSRFLQSFLRCLFFAVVAGCLSAFALLPVYFTLKGSSATSDTFPTSFNSYFNFFDFICQHFSAVEPVIRSSGDPVLPNVSCGIITVMLVILYFYIPSIPLKEKVSRMVLMGIMYVSFNVNYLNFIWHGFHYPNDLPYRQSFCYIFLLVTMAAMTMKHVKEIKGKDLVTVALVTVVFLAVAEKVGSEHLSVGAVIVSVIFIVLYAVVINLINNDKFRETAVAALLFCCMFAEVVVSDITNFEIDQPVSNYAGNYEEFQNVKDFIDEKNGSDDYRMEITGPTRIMEPCWFGYRGISMFSSMAYEKTSNLQYNLGLKSNYVNSYTYELQTPVYNAMFGLKYLVNNDTSTYSVDENYFEQIGHTDTMDIYKNKYALPLCFSVDEDLQNWNYYSSNPFTIQNDWFEKSTGVSDVLADIPIDDITYNNLNTFSEDVSSGSYHYSKTVEDQDAYAILSFTVPETQHVYLYVRGSGVDELNVYNDSGSYSETQNCSEEFVLDLGVHEAGEVLHVKPAMLNNSGNLEVYVAGVNQDQFQKGYDKLNDSGAMDITTWEDTEVSGTVTVGEGEFLYTSINYDDGWTVYVDGQEVPEENIVKLGEALIGVKMDAGEHQVTFKFSAKGYKEGLLLSGTTLVLILLFAVVLPRLKKNGTSGGSDKPKKTKKKAKKAPKKKTKSISSEAPEKISKA